MTMTVITGGAADLFSICGGTWATGRTVSCKPAWGILPSMITQLRHLGIDMGMYYVQRSLLWVK